MPKPSYSKIFKEKPKTKSQPSKAKNRHPTYISIYQPKVTPVEKEKGSNGAIEPYNSAPKNLNVDLTHVTYEEEKVHEVLITDFKFFPQHIAITTNSVVSWRVDKNETVHDSGVYTLEARSFVILIHDSETIESDLLSKDQKFSHRFEKPGLYRIQCANYREIQGYVEVYDNIENKPSYKELEYLRYLEKSPESKKNISTKNTPEMKDSLLLIKDFECEGIKELILELSLKSNSEKGLREHNFSSEDEIIEDFEEHSRRYEKATNEIRNQTDVNIYDSLISREFNGIKIKSRDQSQHSEKQTKQNKTQDRTNILFREKERDFSLGHKEENVARELNFEVPKKAVEERFKMFKNPVLVSIKNPRDEEQKFDLALNHSQECIILSEGTHEEKDFVQSPKEDKFLAFLKQELKGPIRNMKKRINKSNYKKRRGSYKVSNQEIERVSALKTFLTNSKKSFSLLI